MIKCFNCGAETSNGLALCDLCREFGSKCLEFIPVHFGNLARWRPGRAGSRPVPGSRVPRGALEGGMQGDRVEHCLDEVGNDLSTRVRQLADDRGVEIPYANDEVNTVRVACWLLDENLTSISTLDWCGDLIADLRRIETELRKLSEQVVPGWYAGSCRTCETSTYVVPGLTWVTCAGCGAYTYARDHLDIVLTEARVWVAPPMRIAEALVALLDTEMSVPRLHKRISKWGERTTGRNITAIRRLDADGDEVGPKRYRMGDVLDMLQAEGETRLTEPVEVISAEAS